MSVFENRKAKLTEKLSQDSLDGMIVTNLTNVHYLSGFTGSAGTCLILSDESYFFSDGRYLTQSQKQVQGMEVFIDEDPPRRKETHILSEQMNVPLHKKEDDGEKPEVSFTPPSMKKEKADEAVIYGSDLDIPAFIRRQHE